MKVYDLVYVLAYLALWTFGMVTFEPMWVIAAVLFDGVDALRCIIKKLEV